MTNYNTNGLISVDALIRENLKRYSDLTWEGQFDKADRVERDLKHLYQLREAGEVYVPDF